MTAWIVVSVLACLPLFFRTRRFFAPLELDSNDPFRFAPPHDKYRLTAFTGVASDVNKRADAHVSGSISGSSYVYKGTGEGTVRGEISTKIVEHDQFFLTGANGEVRPFKFTDSGIQIGTGHVVSVVWCMKGDRGAVLVVHNKTTRLNYWVGKKALSNIAYPWLFYRVILCLLILPIPVVIVYSVKSGRVQARFKRTGSQPLFAALDRGAGETPALVAPTIGETGIADPSPA